MDILSFGEILWDVYPNEKYIGGAPLNFAVHFVKQGGNAYILSSLGQDELGKMAIEKLENWNVKTDFVQIKENIQTGKCIVTLNCNGIPKYDLLNNVAYDYIDDIVCNKEYDALYFGTLALRSDYNKKTLENVIKNNNFKEIFVDVNIRKPYYTKETIIFALKNATVLKISEEELPIILNEVFSKNFGYKEGSINISNEFKNLKLIIITRGENGSYVYDCRNKETFSKNALKVEVVSTVGAGDSFSAAFLYNYLTGKDLNECLDSANKLSAFVVSKQEAIPNY